MAVYMGVRKQGGFTPLKSMTEEGCSLSTGSKASPRAPGDSGALDLLLSNSGDVTKAGGSWFWGRIKGTKRRAGG